MKKRKLKKLITPALAAGFTGVAVTAAHAQTIVYTGGVVQDTILTSGNYSFTVAGAAGGGSGGGSGGNGALVSGTTYLTAGTTLDVAVGGVGNSLSGYGSGGGG